MKRRPLLLMYLCNWPLAITVLGSPPPDLRLIPKVRTQRFDIAYRITDGISAPQKVELWYTTDEGQTWHDYGGDADLTSPMQFTAPSEGLYGFYLVVSNRAGPSGPDPKTGTPAHRWAYVDYTPPVLQLHAVRTSDMQTGPRLVNLRWSAIDDALISRPLELSYRQAQSEVWRTIESHVANTGSYDWRVPDELAGEIVIRLTVRDRGGHVAETTSGPVKIEPVRSGPETALPGADARTTGESTRSMTEPDAGRGEAQARISLQKGVFHAQRGEYWLATSQLRQALSLDPTSTDALVELGGVLYVQGKQAEAIEAYQIALQYRPGLRSALEGLARVYIRERRFGDAVERLAQIVQADPADARAWLHLGDVAIYQGDEALAREHYQKAATRNAVDRITVEQARLRLADLATLAAEFRQGGGE